MDAKEFEEEYQRLLLPLGMYALRIIENVDDSEDVVQSVFLNTWNRLQEGLETDNLKSYLYRAVRNASLRFVANKNNGPIEDLESLEEVTDDVIDTSERDSRLWKAIESLPEKCREVFLLCKRDNLSYKEVSEELSISEKTVENHMTKAMKALRKAYGITDKHSNVQINIFFLPFL